MTRSRSEQNVPSAVEPVPESYAVVETLASSRRFFDASLLFRCLDMLRIDRSNLAMQDPRLFRELQDVCALCRSKQECAQDSPHEFEADRSNKWWVYCPNSAMLRTLWRSAIIERVERRVP